MSSKPGAIQPRHKDSDIPGSVIAAAPPPPQLEPIELALQSIILLSAVPQTIVVPLTILVNFDQPPLHPFHRALPHRQ